MGWSRWGATKTALWLEFAKLHDIYTQDGWRQNNADLNLLRREWFHHVRHHVHDGHCTGEFATVIWRLDSFTVSFPGDVRGESGLRELASVNRRTQQWASGHVARFTKTIMPAWLKKNGVILNSHTCVNFVVPWNNDVLPLLMMHKTYKMNKSMVK